MSFKSLQELFIHELSDVYSAERQLIRTFSRLARAAHDQRLTEAFEIHHTELGLHIERLDQALESLDVRPHRVKCAAVEALVDDLHDLIEAIESGSLRDIALLASAQKLTRYQIAAHAVVIALARRLDYRDALPPLIDNLEDKNAVDARFAGLTASGAQHSIRAA